jgi:hypothetical protein
VFFKPWLSNLISFAMVYALVLLMLSLSTLGEGRGFLQRSAADVKMDVHAVHQELQAALCGALGNGHGVDRKQILAANATLIPMFQSLPKNEHGRVGTAAMRYAVQRYFSKNHGWIIKGFESHRAEQVQDAGILASKVPGYVEATLEEMLQKGGFSLPDILTVVIVVERLIFDEVARSVEGAYHLNHFATGSLLNLDSLLKVIESHLIAEMLERHEFDEELHVEDRDQILELYPNWGNLQEFMTDVVAMESSTVLRSGAHNPFSSVGRDTFSFDDAVRIAQRISNEYGRWGNQECMELRSFLAEMDDRSSGRVALGDFYKVGENHEKFAFLEMPDYLRGLGALDESSKTLGPQVLISNYAYGMSNCLSSTPYYSVCCLNECEGLLQQIETQVAKPSASASEILDVMKRIRVSPLTADEPELTDKLRTRLEEIAAKAGGKVSLHGRLFAQWLHYAFPHECPFPHAAGSLSVQTQGERLNNGDDIFIDPAEISKHVPKPVLQNGETSSEADEDELWSWDEELMHAPESKDAFASHPQGSRSFLPWAGLVAAVLLFGVKKLQSVVATATTQQMSLPQKGLYV